MKLTPDVSFLLGDASWSCQVNGGGNLEGCSGEGLSGGIDSSANVSSGVLKPQPVDVERDISKVEKSANPSSVLQTFLRP
jgi:hypothetical protein